MHVLKPLGDGARVVSARATLFAFGNTGEPPRLVVLVTLTRRVRPRVMVMSAHGTHRAARVNVTGD